MTIFILKTYDRVDPKPTAHAIAGKQYVSTSTYKNQRWTGSFRNLLKWLW